MVNKFTDEQMEKAKECKTVEELLVLANENGITPTESEATNYFAQLNLANGQLADSELEIVAGGGGCGNNRTKEEKANDRAKKLAPKCICGDFFCHGEFSELIYGYGASFIGKYCGSNFSLT